MRKIVSGAVAGVLALAFGLFALVLLAPLNVAAQESVPSFDAHYVVHPDGSVDVTETIVYDFGSAERHGIFRNLVDRQACAQPSSDTPPESIPVYECPSGRDRVYELKVLSVTDEAGQPYKYEVSRKGDGQQIKIGDADKTITGQHTYVIRYQLGNALDAYPQHDEFYWNATGSGWDAAIAQASVTLELPEGAQLTTNCYQGYGRDSTWDCDGSAAGNIAQYRSVNSMSFGEQMTIVATWEKGLVAVAPPVTKDQPSIDDYFALDFWELGGAGLLGIAGIAGVITLWWRKGRDRTYSTIHYLTNDTTEETKPLFGRQQVVVEYTPPDDLRPAQVGLLLDERADTLDVTATIVDLAVRGHLHITQIDKKFRKDDWELQRQQSEDELLPYESKLLNALFEDGDTVQISTLKNKFYKDLAEVKKSLYSDAMKRKWFMEKPETKVTIWAILAIVVIGAGAGLAVLSGIVLGRALLGLPIIIAGLLLLILAPSMKRRSAKGSEALRRVLGFRLYMETAEKRIQEFNEREQILNKFAKYLPYAMVFGLVDRWAKAFEQIGDEVVQQSTTSWYSGVTAFNVANFSSGMRSFSSSVSSNISSSPSSGGSGSGGGFAGGGGGGGGGGSW